MCWVVCNSKIVHAWSFQIKGVVLIYGILHDMICFKLKYVHDVSRLHKHNGCRPQSRRRLTFWTKLSPFVFYDRSLVSLISLIIWLIILRLCHILELRIALYVHVSSEYFIIFLSFRNCWNIDLLGSDFSILNILALLLQSISCPD